MFLKNHWYVAAWSEDIGREPLGRVILGEYVCLYRTQDGAPVALENRCPHRNLPLSEGNLIGDSLQCAYHGLEFDCSGACTHIPGQTEIPAWTKVRRYKLAERNRWVFIWMGDPDRADESLIPDYHKHLADPNWVAVTGQTHVQAGYRLVLDNLLDLSHLTYVHGSTTGNAAVAENAMLETVTDGDNVTVTRTMTDIPPATAFVEYGGYQENIDRWQISTFMAPGYIDICNGSEKVGTGTPKDARKQSQGDWGFVVYHALTPETETTTHQFWCVAGEDRCVTPEKRDLFGDQMRNVLKEDLDVYEAQQKCITLDPDAVGSDANPRGTIPADDGLLQMRRVIRRLYGEEQKDVANPA
jgi:phenylpropionate dioxygenase-like ring-hydroxylating dioxygenase large terminal subunit